MNKILGYLVGWKGYAALALAVFMIGIYSGYKVKDLIADSAYYKLDMEYSEYRLAVAEEANSTNRRTLAELALHAQYIGELESRLQLERSERNQASYTLTEPLRNVTDETDDTIGPALSDYLNRLRDYQRTYRPN
jgi:hypothetical protein